MEVKAIISYLIIIYYVENKNIVEIFFSLAAKNLQFYSNYLKNPGKVKRKIFILILKFNIGGYCANNL